VQAKLHTFLTSALDGGDWSASYSGPFNSPSNERLGGSQSWSKHEGKEKNLPLPRIKPQSSSPEPVTSVTEIAVIWFTYRTKVYFSGSFFLIMVRHFEIIWYRYFEQTKMYCIPVG
jgi:hypothetical protein